MEAAHMTSASVESSAVESTAMPAAAVPAAAVPAPLGQARTGRPEQRAHGRRRQTDALEKPIHDLCPSLSGETEPAPNAPARAS
jgi:hypothetical protein